MTHSVNPRLAAAQARRPFANGTEAGAWIDKWCNHCVHDHAFRVGSGPGCELIGNATLVDFPTGDNPWPEAWLPEPDDGTFAMPSRLACRKFQPCKPCGGDPAGKERARRIDAVATYWDQLEDPEIALQAEERFMQEIAKRCGVKEN
ncbi:MAG TPA: hypothetical protein VM328_11005 [Fimbriimonadaceae bacterium]|nr:hypothetical protein [Fimbriimonadaceae bacterium]